MSADAVLSSPDALPVNDILRAITPVEAELLRLLLLVPDEQLRVVDELGPDQLPSTRRARAVPGDRPPAGAERPGRPPAVRSAALLLALDDETRALARALYADGPDAPSTGRTSSYEIDTLLLDLEDDQLRERSDYNEAAQGEAERAGDPDAIDPPHERTTSDQ